jgi:hypothetical protein
MMAVAVEDGGGKQRRQRWTTIAAEDDGMRDRAVDYDREGQERAAREGGDSGVAMMDVATEDGSGRQQWQWRTRRMATADNNSGKQ